MFTVHGFNFSNVAECDTYSFSTLCDALCVVPVVAGVVTNDTITVTNPNGEIVSSYVRCADGEWHIG